MRGVTSIVPGRTITIQEATGETNLINTLKVHENLKNHEQISVVKTARGDKITIQTYSATAGSASSPVCVTTTTLRKRTNRIVARKKHSSPSQGGTEPRFDSA